MIKRILAVEDEPDILEILQLIFSGEGYDVKTSSSGKDVFNIIDTFDPHLIVMDIMLGELDGRDICKNLKSNRLTNHIPVIMVSAHPGIGRTVEEVGANDFLPKPFDIDELLERVQIHMS
ncbi:MAG: response regulator receiver [Sphingobacteriales bacterium]|nr:response regulator receiver [Sphingobacteriales bacterium]